MKVFTAEVSYTTSRSSENEIEESISFDATDHAVLPPREKNSLRHGNSVDISGTLVKDRCERITSNLLDTYRNFSLLRAKFADFQDQITSCKHSKRASTLARSRKLHSKRCKSKNFPGKQTPSYEMRSQTVARIQCKDQSVQTVAPVENEQKIDPTLATATPVIASQPVENLVTHILTMRLALERVVGQLQKLNADSHDTRQIGYSRHMKQVDYLSSLVIGMDRVKKSLQNIEFHLEELFIYMAEGQDVHLTKVESNFANVSSLIQDLRTVLTSQENRDAKEIVVRFGRNPAVIGAECSLASPLGNEERQEAIQTRLKPPNRASTHRRLPKRQKIRRSQAQLIKRLRAECQALRNITAERSERIRTLEEERERRNAFFDRVQGFAENLLRQTHTSLTNGPHTCQCHTCPDDKAAGNEMIEVSATPTSATSQLLVTQDDLDDRQPNFSHRQRSRVTRNLRTPDDVKVLLSRQRLLRRTWELSCLNSGERLAALNRCYKHLFDHNLSLRKRYLQLTSSSARRLRIFRKRSERLSQMRALRWKKLNHKVQRLEIHYKLKVKIEKLRKIEHKEI